MPGMKDRPAMGGVAAGGVARRRHRHHRQLVPDDEQVIRADHVGWAGDTEVAGRLSRVLLLEQLDAVYVLLARVGVLEDVSSRDGHGLFPPPFASAALLGAGGRSHGLVHGATMPSPVSATLSTVPAAAAAT